ncbi:hypothetical protein H4F51_19700 [Pectobacterium brasiliense]|uniref:DUF6896 domain-containing protein n=1 Tax=Pectobacterium brasiliense TaxID=180957 RepID=UPI0015DD83A8|nr:hypothetical protein [Pectobacterium brasiliense]MBA0195569.1 hypothetical protein [Pectobacterium brasiliense]MBN3092212.1 hypothetical protein [Pectobacterium brasiliense]MBN3124155.1 hypothetical protein [Pectobacterium brasiliense]MBN3142140.1 hypothetical protein [Pectobacterium brasiliense]MBN3145970.1 hypothetical protein [Pectobacterium brasiliense]
MNNNLVRLITDYQRKVIEAVTLMQRSGIRMPVSSHDWIFSDVPYSGELYGEIKYFKHGEGCLVMLNSGEVDFDFGQQGEIGGFNSWWLTRFAGLRLSEYGFNSEIEIFECLKSAFDAGELVNSIEGGLYYIAGVQYTFAVDIDGRVSGDILPSRTQDRVLVLQSHYFQTAELMLENYEKLDKKFYKNNRLNRREGVDRRIYLVTWLGFLGVTCEGFRNLNMHLLLINDRPSEFNELIQMSGNIGRMMKIHADSLREFRNNVFHLRESPEVIYRFFGNNEERLSWARELHVSLARFFSKYRLLCEIHYIKNGRMGESDLRRNKISFKKHW